MAFRIWQRRRLPRMGFGARLPGPLPRPFTLRRRSHLRRRKSGLLGGGDLPRLDLLALTLAHLLLHAGFYRRTARPRRICFDGWRVGGGAWVFWRDVALRGWAAS